MALAVSCTNEQKITINLAPQTSSGKPAVIDGAPTITKVSGDGDIELDPTNPLSFKAVSGDVLGDTVYDVAGDADLGPDTVTIHDTVTLTVTSAVAANFGLSAGPIEAK